MIEVNNTITRTKNKNERENKQETYLTLAAFSEVDNANMHLFQMV